MSKVFGSSLPQPNHAMGPWAGPCSSLGPLFFIHLWDGELLSSWLPPRTAVRNNGQKRASQLHNASHNSERLEYYYYLLEQPEGAFFVTRAPTTGGVGERLGMSCSHKKKSESSHLLSAYYVLGISHLISTIIQQCKYDYLESRWRNWSSKKVTWPRLHRQWVMKTD